MPDIDRDALNRALYRYLVETEFPAEEQQKYPALTSVLMPPIVDYCGSLDAAVTALNALGLGWQRFYADGWHLAVGPRDVLAGPWLNSLYPDDLAAPAALATALVQAALEVLKSEEETDA